MEKAIMRLLITGLVIATAGNARGAETGRIGISAKVEVVSGNYLTGRFAPGLSFLYEAVGATESVGFRLDGSFSMWPDDIMGAGLSAGVGWNVLPQNETWHLALFAGLQGSVNLLTFEPPGQFSTPVARFVLDLGPQVGIQLIHQRSKNNLGYVVLLSIAGGWRNFLDGQVHSESTHFGTVSLAVGIVF